MERLVPATDTTHAPVVLRSRPADCRQGSLVGPAGPWRGNGMLRRRRGSASAGFSAPLAGVTVAATLALTGGLAPAQEVRRATVGQPAPPFELTALDGKTHSLARYAAKVVVLEWFAPDCPYVAKHYEEPAASVRRLIERYRDRGVVWLSIASGPHADRDRLKEAVSEWKLDHTVLLDPDGRVARAYGAKTTPHVFVIKRGVVRYAGAMDDDRTPDLVGEEQFVERAIRALLEGRLPTLAETKPYGCELKLEDEAEEPSEVTECEVAGEATDEDGAE